MRALNESIRVQQPEACQNWKFENLASKKNSAAFVIYKSFLLCGKQLLARAVWKHTLRRFASRSPWREDLLWSTLQFMHFWWLWCMSHKGNKLLIGWSKVKHFPVFLLIICEREERKLMQRHKLVFEQRGICFIMMVLATVLFKMGKGPRNI